MPCRLAIQILCLMLSSLIGLSSGGTGASQQGRTLTQEEEFVRLKTNGVSYFKLGDMTRSSIFLEKALKLRKDDGDLYYYLSQVYTKLGNQKVADQYLNLARQYQSVELSRNIPPSTRPSPPVVSSDFSPGEKPISLSGRVREKWALVVGVSEFADSKIPRLQYAAKDARDFAATLTDPAIGRFKPTHLAMLTNQEATTKAIRAALNQIAKNALAEDLVVIFLSSHGSPGKADLVGEGYLVTYDTELADLYATAFPMRDFTRDVKQRIQAQRKVVFLDTCYSGQASTEGTKGLQLVGELQNQAAQDLCGFGSVVITSSSPHEQSWESPTLQNGYFTHFLIQALHQEDGYLPIAKVFSFLQDMVPKTVRQEKEAAQNPRIMPQPLQEAAEIRIGVKTN